MSVQGLDFKLNHLHSSQSHYFFHTILISLLTGFQWQVQVKKNTVATSRVKVSLWHSRRLLRWRTTETDRGKGSGSYTQAQFKSGHRL